MTFRGIHNASFPLFLRGYADFVNTFIDKSITVDAKSFPTIDKVEAEIQDEKGIPLDQQRLILC